MESMCPKQPSPSTAPCPGLDLAQPRCGDPSQQLTQAWGLDQQSGLLRLAMEARMMRWCIPRPLLMLRSPCS